MTSKKRKNKGHFSTKKKISKKTNSKISQKKTLIKKPTVLKKFETAKRKYKKKKWRFKKFFAWFFYTCIILGLIGAIAFTAFVAYISKDLPTTDGLINRVVPETTKLYDKTGQHVIYELHGDEKRTVIEINDIPSYVYNAVVALEDKDFYNHKGIVPRRVLKAAYVDGVNIVWKIFTGHKKTFYQGASTLTQQLVKNSILTDEFSITRKLKEMILAWQLEKRFDKQQILKMYLNEIPFGSVYYGLESAAQNYFAKSAKDLSIAEAAVLAAMIQRPSYFSPYGSHVDELLERQQIVINLLEDQNYISNEEAELARKEEIVFKAATTNIEAPHFVMYTINYVQELLGEEYNEQLLQEGGLKIYTTVDLDLQKIGEETISNQIKNVEAHGADNAGLVAINPKNGHILAMVGSRDYFDEEYNGQYNVTVALRQPGSSIKPLTYLAAFDKGYYPETILYDTVTSFSGYIPKNYDGKEHGQVTMRQALQWSLNIPAVKTLYLSGLTNVINLAQKFGYTTVNDPDRYGLSFVLGGAEVKLLEHTSAFATFANNGLYYKTTPITKIVDRYGEIIKEYIPHPEQIIKADSVKTLTSVLSDNNTRASVFGVNNDLYLGNRPVAAKTGTTNNYKDAWTMGYTPSLAVGVWSGNNDNTEMNYGSGGISVAAPIWNEFMRKALDGTEIEYFAAAPHNNNSKAVLNGNIAKGTPVKIDKISGKLATENTPEEFVEEKKFMQVHNILYYCDKNNPSGPVPSNPANDPMFNNWEASVQAWLIKYNEKANKDPNDDKEPIDTTAPPTEYDDTHTEANKPQLDIISPKNNALVSGNKLKIAVKAQSMRGIKRYEYFIDGKVIPGNNTSYLEASLYDLNIGDHTVTVKVSDDVGNFREKTHTFTLSENNFLAEISIIYPQNNYQFFVSSFPLVFTINVMGANKINNLELCYKNLSGTDDFTCSELTNYLLDGQNTVRWKIAPDIGNYKYYLKANTNNGSILTDHRFITFR